LKTQQETKVSGTFPPKSRMGVAMALKTATTLENGDSVLDEPLMAGIAVDILKVLKDNKGGREGGQVFEHGGQQYLKPKNMNKLQEDIGKAVERRILKRNEQGPGYDPNKDKDLIRKITPEDRSALASGLITMARGNFGNNRDLLTKGVPEDFMGPLKLNRPSLISEDKAYTKNAKGVTQQELLLTTSDFYDNWYRTPSIKKGIKGNHGKRWIDLLDGPLDPALPSIRPHGRWVVKDGKVTETPLGMRPEDFLAGRATSKYSMSWFDPETLNILNETPVGVDKALFAGWKFFSGEGFFRDSGMTNLQFNRALEESGLEPQEMGLVINYFKDIAKHKAHHIAMEDKLRAELGEPPLTAIEKVNAFKPGKANKIRKEITDAYKEASLDSRSGTKGGKIDDIVDDLLDIYSGQSIRKEVQTSQRSIRKRLIKEIERRFDLQDDAEVHTLFKFDYRGRVYAIDPSGANVQTGGFVRHMFRFPKELGVDITYGDQSFHRIVDDLILFEDFPIAGAKIGKSEVSGLERYAYFKKNENEYLRRAKELLEVFEKGIDDEKALRNYKNKAKWLRNRGDAGPYVSALLEIGRIRRAYDTPSKQRELFEKGTALTNISDSGPVQAGVMSVEEPSRQAYRSTFALEFDAPQSGSQHIGAQYGDVDTMFKTSVFSESQGVKRLLTNDELADLHAGVAPESVAPDLYRDISIDYDGFWRSYLKELALSDPAKAKAFEEATKAFMKSGRGVTKPIVMKIPYGAGMARLKNELFEQLTSRNRLQMKEMGVDPTDFMNQHWSAMESALEKGLKTQFEFREWNRGFGKIYENAWTGAITRKPLLVKSPFGGVSDLTIYATTTERMRGVINPSRVPDIKTKTTTSREKTGRIKADGTPEYRDKTKDAKAQYYDIEIAAMAPDDFKTRQAYQKAIDDGKAPEDLGLLAVEGRMLKEGPLGVEDQRNMYGALAPNATHNIDAGFLQMLVVEAKKLGIPVMVVHDAFFIRPTDVDVFRQLAGKVFKDLHNGYNLRKEMIDALHEATGIPIPQIIKDIETHLREVMPDPMDAVDGFRSGYYIDRNNPKSMELPAEVGGPIENIGFNDMFSPKGAEIKERVSSRGDDVTMENVIRGG
jgi:hypothetical protein